MKKIKILFGVITVFVFIVLPFNNTKAQSLSVVDIQILNQKIDQLIFILNSFRSQLPASLGNNVSSGNVPTKDMRVLCPGGGSVVVTNVPVTMTLNPDYWCPRGGGNWTWGISYTDIPSSAYSILLPESTQRIGFFGEDVMNLQKSLVFLGLLDPTFVIGIYGPRTTESIRRFQRENNLSADGVAGPITLNKMREVINLKIQALSEEKTAE